MSEDNNDITDIRLRFLKSFCPDYLYEEIEGDLIQRYERDVKTFGEQVARRRLTWSVIKFCRPGIVLRNRFSIELNQGYMLRNYLQAGFRNLIKRKLYSFVNITGLAIGLAVCLVLWKYVEFELSYDRFHNNATGIYRVTSSLYSDGHRNPYLGYDVGPALSTDMPEIKSFVRTHDAGETMVTILSTSGAATTFEETKILIADSTFLNVFTHEVIKGNKQNPLSKPGSVVLTESMAHKYFGDSDPIGKVLTFKGGWVKSDYTVTAVIKDVPSNSSIPFDFLLSIHELLNSEFYSNNNARWDNFFTYVELYPAADIQQLESKTPAFLIKYRGDDKNVNAHPSLKFQPLTDIHYSPDLENEGSYRKTIYFYILISVFILFIAWINYVNLATARATERSKEVGVKKAIGVTKKQLVTQFLIESFLINFIAIVLAVGLAVWLLPVLGGIVNKQFSFDFTQRELWYWLGGLFLVGSVVSGIYPAFVLSSFKTTEVIKGGVLKLSRGLSLRQVLVVFQFAASLLLITGTFVIYRQIRFMQNQEMGMNMKQMLIVRGPKSIGSADKETSLITFKNQVKTNSFVSHVSTSWTIPGGSVVMNILMHKDGSKDTDGKMGDATWVDTDFIETYGIKVIAGRSWDPATQVRSVLVNETAVSMLGFGTPEQALNEKIIIGKDTVKITGVLKDFHWNSLKNKQAPMAFYGAKVFSRLYSIQLSGSSIPEAIQKIREQFEAAFPGNPFEYYFQDEFFNRQYSDEQQFEKIFMLFSGLAVLIACLGLWGLTSFTVIQRLKEISIRKVLGASVTNVVSILTWQYLKLILIASAIAIPLTFIVAPNWLEGFAFRISLTPDLVVVPLLILSALAFTTIGTLVIKAAIANPAKALKSE